VRWTHQVSVHSGNITEIKSDTDIKTVIYDIPVALDHSPKRVSATDRSMKKIFILEKTPGSQRKTRIKNLISCYKTPEIFAFFAPLRE